MSQYSKQRRNLRYHSPANTMAKISLTTDPLKFSEDLLAVIVQESHQGCGVVYANYKLDKEQKIHIKSGQLSVLSARIAWIKELDKGENIPIINENNARTFIF